MLNQFLSAFWLEWLVVELCEIKLGKIQSMFRPAVHFCNVRRKARKSHGLFMRFPVEFVCRNTFENLSGSRSFLIQFAEKCGGYVIYSGCATCTHDSYLLMF